MEAKVYLKNIHITPKKLRYLLPEIKKMTPYESLNHLYYSPQKGARLLYKAIKSALDNAKYTLKLNEDLLQFKLFTIEQGNALKRYRPGGRGTAKPYKKRFSHIKIILEAKQAQNTAKSIEKSKIKEIGKTEKKTKKGLQIDSGKRRAASHSPEKKKEVKK
ncbi:MAG: uL22 family ribosomal protein [Patescibacteria group bacterium]